LKLKRQEELQLKRIKEKRKEMMNNDSCKILFDYDLVFFV
jgi:hypothetical protein